MNDMDPVHPELTDRVRAVAEGMHPAVRYILLGSMDENVLETVAQALKMSAEQARDLSGQVLRAVKDEVFGDKKLPPPSSGKVEPAGYGAALLQLLEEELAGTHRRYG
jgi:hypothetical protein